MPIFVIAPLVLSEIDAAAIGRLRHAHDPHAKLVPPHVTFVFGVDDAMERSATVWARSAAKAVSACELRYTRMTVARDYENSAWYLFAMPRQIPDGLRELARRLTAGPLREAPNVAFDAHLTLGRFPEYITADAVARDLNAEGFAWEAKVQSLDVLRFDGTAVLNSVSLPLGQ